VGKYLYTLDEIRDKGIMSKTVDWIKHTNCPLFAKFKKSPLTSIDQTIIAYRSSGGDGSV
jgi:hypothetical protein